MDDETYRYFRVEAGELHRALHAGALKLERGADPALLAQLLRQAHTLKGAAAVVKNEAIAGAAHAIEDALMPARQSGAVPHEAIERVLARLDGIVAAFRALDSGRNGAGGVPESREAAHDVHIVRSDARELDRLLDGVAEAAQGVATIAGRGGDFQQLRRLLEVLSGQLRSSGMRARPEEIRNWQRMLSLLDEVRSLGTRIEHGVLERAEVASQELRQVREEAEQLRLVPADVLIDQLERTARDGAAASGTDVALRTSGAGIRLDADMLGIVRPALLQLVRNAVAHGIEPAAERTRQGKPGQGTITVGFARQGHHVVFSCADDGRGVDRAALARRAHGSTGDTQAQAIDDGRLLDLLLDAGISTAATVSREAGRGVGMGIVREACAALGGRMSLRSSPAGTAFEIIAPMTLASLDMLLCRIGEMTIALPSSVVAGITRPSPDQISGTQPDEALVHEGRALPLRRIASALGVAEVPTVATAVLVAHAGRVASLAVDQAIGSARLVLRPVPRLAPLSRCITGVGLDVDGHVVYAIDPEVAFAAVVPRAPARADRPARKPLLVVDDSLTTRMLERSILRSAGYEVETASSGEEGLRMARERSFALFLVDVDMPGISGYDFVRAARADPLLAGIPAILVTSRGDAADRQRGADAGAKAYIVKGEFDQGVLLRHIRELTGS